MGARKLQTLYTILGTSLIGQGCVLPNLGTCYLVHIWQRSVWHKSPHPVSPDGSRQCCPTNDIPLAPIDTDMVIHKKTPVRRGEDLTPYPSPSRHTVCQSMEVNTTSCCIKFSLLPLVPSFPRDKCSLPFPSISFHM